MTLENKNFIKLLTATALPVVLQNLLQNSLSFCDTLMIGQLGEIEIAAVGLANQLYFLVSVLFYGVSTGTAIFTAQFWGNKDTDSMQKAVGVGLVFGVGIALLFSCISIFIPNQVLGIFNNEKAILNCGSKYLRWVGISYIFVSVSQTVSMNIRSTGDTKSPMYITLASMIMNIIGNYLLIFVAGLGVVGGAISTTVSRLFEMVAIIFVNQKKCLVPLVLNKVFGFDRSFVNSFFNTSLPVILDDGAWALGLTVYKYVYAHMGTQVLASVNITENIQNLFFVVQMGLGSAASILVGNEIGRGSYKRAHEMAKIITICAAVVGFVSGLFMFATSSILPGLFNVSFEVFELTRKSLIALSLIITFKEINHVNIAATFRSGGDTKFILILELITIWLIGVPAAFFSGLYLKLPIYIVYLFVGLEEIVKMIASTPRLLSGKWIHDLTK